MGGSVSEYVRYLELSREPKHVAQQMRYQSVDLSNGYCLGTIIIFINSFIHSFISQSTPLNVAFTASRHVQEYSKKTHT